MSDTFCVLPWIQASIKPSGMMTTCCVMRILTKSGEVVNRETQKKIKEGSLPFSRLWWENQTDTYICGKDSIFDIINNKLLKEVRLSMLAGKKHPACATCWKRERYSNKQVSVRIANQRWHNIMNYDIAKKITSDDGSIEPNIKSLELRFGNHCNLKCVMCHPGHSDLWYKDWKQLSKWNTFWTDDGSDENSFLFGGTYYSMDDLSPFQWYKTEKFKDDFSKIYQGVKEIYWAGGEPLLCKEHKDILKIIIENGNPQDIQMRYDSNLTFIPDELIDYWKKFKWVNIQASVDDIGIRNDYIRYPSKWKIISSHLKKLNDELGKHRIYSGTTLSCYNILTFMEFAKWAKENMNRHFWEVMHWKHVVAPFHLSPRILPKHVKLEAIKRIDSHLKSEYCPPSYTAHYMKMEMFKNYLLEEIDYYNEEFYKGFIQHTKNLEKLRSIKFKETFPELYNMIKEDYDRLY